jgi:cell division protein FtsW
LTATLADPSESPARREAVLLGLGFAFLLLAAASLTLGAGSQAWAVSHLLLPPAWAACAWLLHRTLNRVRPMRDPFLLPTALVLMGWGVLTVGRLFPEFGARQLAWMLAAVVVIYETLAFRNLNVWLRRFRLAWLSLGLILLALTLLFGTNPSGGEARLWLGCCGQYLQPSEPLRLLLVAYLASYFADRLMPGSERPARSGLLPVLLPLLLLWGLAVALLAVQRDLGAGSLFLLLLTALLYLIFQRWEALAAGGVLLLTAGAAAAFLSPVVLDRVESWLNPWADPLAASYQILQGMMAMAAGGLTGVGPGAGLPVIVPAAHTDFIFAAIIEEWGLAGGLGLLILLALLTVRGLRAATRAADPYTAILAGGLSISIGLQAVLILAGVLRLLPLTGVPLPLVSYGGSSLLTTAFALGLILRISAAPGPRPRFAASVRRIYAASLIAFTVMALAATWWSVVRGPALRARPENPRSVELRSLPLAGLAPGEGTAPPDRATGV